MALARHTYMLRGEGLSESSFSAFANEIREFEEYERASTASIVLRRETERGEIEICVPLEGRGKSKGWHLIGGKRFGAENTTVAAMREFMEETGLTAEPLRNVMESISTSVVYWPIGQVLVYVIDLEEGHPYRSIDVIHSYVDKLSENPKTTFADLKWVSVSAIEDARVIKETGTSTIIQEGIPIPSDTEIRQKKDTSKAQQKEEMKKSYRLSGMFDSMLNDARVREIILYNQ